MDWIALDISLRLGVATVAALLPIGLLVGYTLAFTNFRGRPVVEAFLALPLVLPPTVLGYYLLVALGGNSTFGKAWEAFFGHSLVFSFEGLLIGSIVANTPFAVQPIQRALEAIPKSVREAAQVSGFSPWQVAMKIDVPLALPGIVTGMILTFAHTLGEFGVVLMLGGSIPGETRTIAISIYDKVQSFDMADAGQMALILMFISLAALIVTFWFANKAIHRG